MSFIINDFFLDFFLLFIPFYFLYFYNNLNSFKLIFKSQGIKYIYWKKLIRHVFILFFLMFVISYAISLVAMFFGAQDLNLVSSTIVALPITYVLYLFVVRVFLEEWFFRGFLVNKVGVIISSVLFAAGHILYGSITEVIGAFVLGVLLARYYLKTGNLWITFIAHFIYNSVAYAFMVLG